ncbi:hypothetical protein LDENG_00153210 [Lucifuga dentata]|nr:hypothetical protein LDENG_00153210 [Lucifuga dentata]
MMRRSDNMRERISELATISDNLDKVQKKNKTMGIAGGTTGAVGGVTAVVGLALAPVTLGASLIATAIGAGMVASAGGIGAHTASAHKKIVNRKEVERLVQDYKADVVDLEHCLAFVLCGMNELRRHELARLQRGGAQLDALKMAHLSQSVFKDETNNTWGNSYTLMAGMSSDKLLQDFAMDINEYFSSKNGQKLKRSKKGRFSSRVRVLAQNLQDELNYLTHMWEIFSQL